MPCCDRIALTAAACLYMSGQICEALLDWYPHTIEWTSLLVVSAGLVCALALAWRHHS